MKPRTHRKKHQSPKKNQGAIALTGSGYKGNVLLHWLENDSKFDRIILFSHKRPAGILKKTKFYRLDLTENLADVQLAELLQKENVDTLIHTAFPITPPRNIARAHELISVGSMYICTAASEAKVRKLILASTADVYGPFPDNPNYLTEEHLPRGGIKTRFLADKIDAENQFLRYAKKNPGSIVTILRPCTILGPKIRSYKTRYLSRFFVPTVLGFDPLVQFIHEKDLMRAFQIAILKDCPGIYNLAGKGVMPLSRAIRAMGKIPVPLSLLGLKTLIQLLWFLDISPAPAPHLEFLKYMCVVATEKAAKGMGFIPKYSSKEALLDFVGAQRLREVHLNPPAEAT